MVEPMHGLARNALGLPQVLFCIVTGAAPIAAMLFNDPWAVFGGGWAAPSAFIIATVGFTVFSVGYIAMARRVTAAGGFYSFASHGFGQTIGMGVALLIAACYLIFSAGVTGVTAYFANTTIDDWIGVDIPVWVFEFGTLAVDDHARLLPHRADGEDPRRLPRARADRAADVRHLRALPAASTATSRARCCRGTSSTATPTAPTRRSAPPRSGVGFFGAFWSWIGFEMAPNYAEESKDPKRIMSPATYISVIGLGVLYTFICWMLVVSWGKNGITGGVTSQFNGDIASVFYPQTDRVFPIDLGSASLLTRAFQLTIVTGSFACQLAFFNTATRYLFSMGREGILPRQVGRTHPTHKSPHVAAFIVGGLAALIIGGFLLYDSSTLGALLKLGTWAPMMGTSASWPSWAWCRWRSSATSRLRRRVELDVLSAVVAPLVAAGIMFGATWLLIDNRNTLSGGAGIPFVEYMWVPPLVVFIIGMALAQLYRSRDRTRYEGIGRYLHEDVPSSGD